MLSLVFVVPMFVFTQTHEHTHPYQLFPSEELTVVYQLPNFEFLGTSLGSKYQFIIS